MWSTPSALGNRGGHGMPSAPGAQLDDEAMQAVLRTGQPTRPKTAVAATATAQSTTRAPTQNYAAAVMGRDRGRGRGGHCENHHGGCNANSRAGGACSVRQPYDAYVVLDFEATCEADKRISNQEVIEFPLVVVDPATLRVVAEFQRYVRPVIHPRLSAFCTELTGITQAMVDPVETFPTVLDEALAFLGKLMHRGDAAPQRSYCFVTCGDWDLKTMLPAQLRASGHRSLPASFSRWCNLKVYMKSAQPPFLHRGRPSRLSGMPDMLEVLGLTLEGRHHSGIDDCRNIARVLIELMRRGHVVRPTFSMKEAHTDICEWRVEASKEEDQFFGARTTLYQDLSPTDVAVKPASSPTTAPTSAAACTPELAAKVSRTERQAAERLSSNKRNDSREPLRTPQRMPPIVADTARDPVVDLLAAHPVSRPPSAADMKTISKAISTVLRHQADKAGIRISSNGYCLLTDILGYGVLRSRHVTAADVAEIVAGNDKQRFRMVYDTTSDPASSRVYIAAVQGHSLDGVVVDLKSITTSADVPEAVIHGTYWDALRKIRECGYLSVMTRHHIHFAKGLPSDSGVISGMRASAQVVLYLDVEKCIADGVPLLESANGVILTPGVGDTGRLPLTYIAKAIDRKTGKPIPLS